MKVVTPGQMNEIDSKTINGIGIPGVVLMENAALKVVEEICRSLGNVSGRLVCIFAGKGNNGGDAFAAARHLYNKGALIRVYITAKKKDIRNDAAVNLGILGKMNVETVELAEDVQISRLRSELAQADMIVDGIFGTGFKGKIEAPLQEIIEAVNNSGKFVLSIDIPSGVNGETGEVQGICIKADKTVTFGLPKIGLVVYPGCGYTGELITADIGIPRSVEESVNIKVNITEKHIASKLIPLRYAESNKGDYGKVLIVSGSAGMTGAGCLAAGAALKVGAGLVYLGVPSSLVGIYGSNLIEAVTIPLEDNKKGYISKENIGFILEKLENMDVAAVGPGLSTNKDIAYIVNSIVENSKIPLVLDADALNVISEDISVLKKLKADAVVTPHPGEMSRLCGISIKDVQNNRIKTAQEFSRAWGVITVLKGARTVVATPDGDTFINPTGNPGMASAGMGDVLTGIIAGLIGQGATPEDAAIAGTYLHGAAGNEAAAEKGEHGIVAGDILKELPYTIKLLLG